MVKQVIQSVREFVGPVAAFKTAVIVPQLPKVRKGSEMSIWKMELSTCRERGTEKIWVSVEIEPMTSRTPGRHSIHRATRTHRERGHFTDFIYDTRHTVVFESNHSDQSQRTNAILWTNQNSKLLHVVGSAGKCARARHDWFWLYFWLVEKVTRMF